MLMLVLWHAQELEAAAYDLVFMDIHMPVRAL